MWSVCDQCAIQFHSCLLFVCNWFPVLDALFRDTTFLGVLQSANTNLHNTLHSEIPHVYKSIKSSFVEMVMV